MNDNPYIDPEGNGYSRGEVERAAQQLREADIEDGIIRWPSNGRVLPEDLVEFAAHLGLPVDPARCSAVRDADLDEFVAAYREARRNGPTAEELAEAQAAHGPGVELVNVLTGERWTT